ncbi:MAG: hypothetical protein HIU93_08145 [Acidobacteria bacterium]|nr:hypothetical protein [Acidobacteriota bacterium]
MSLPFARYNHGVDQFIHFSTNLLVILFFVGLAGSSVVVIISFIEDLHELFGE